MSWLEEDVLQLIELVRRRPAIYDKGHESFYNEKVKNTVARELAQIIDSTRPGTTVSDVLTKWEELYLEFLSYYKMSCTSKKKRLPPPPAFYNKLQFLGSVVDTIDIKQKAEVNLSIENLSNIHNETKGIRGSVEEDQENLEMGMPMSQSSSLEGTGKRRKDLASSSVSSISGLDESPRGERRKGKKMRPFELSKNTRAINSSKKMKMPMQEFSLLTLPSPLMNVNDSILDRTQPLPDSDTNLVDSFESNIEQEEDMLYMKYIACRLKKLNESQKLRFKVEIENLFYNSMNKYD